jgi:hypothetical protein
MIVQSLFNEWGPFLWQLSRGMGGRLHLESVATLVWNTQTTLLALACPDARIRAPLTAICAK